MKEKIAKFKFPLIAIFVILLLIFAFFYFKNSGNQQAQMPFPREVEVDVISIKKELIQVSKEFPARISAAKIAQVKPQISGIIKEILFSEGSKVKKNQALYKIEPEIYAANLKSAKSKYDASLANFERAKMLIKEEAISQKEFDDAKSELDSSKAELEAAKINFSYTKVLAPISGYISASNFNEGNLVSANQTSALATISAFEKVDAEIVIPSKDFALFKNQKNLEVALIVNDEILAEKGVLKFSENFVDAATDSIKMHSEFKNQDEKLLDGMFAKAQVFLPQSNEILIAQRATMRSASGVLTAAKITQGNIVKFSEITTKGIYKDNWIVESGVNEGDLIVIAGYQKVKDGAKVKINLK